ncbi:retrovirus-related pol polyprotein from transposon TNT 1-94 [Tanacetum coccineum]
MPITIRLLTLQISMGENSDDEVDERSSEEYLKDLDIEYHERALLPNSKRHFARDYFSKTSEPSYKSLVNNYSSGSKGFQLNFTQKLIQSSSNSNSQVDPKFQKDYKAEYKNIKAKLALLEASPSSSQNPKNFQLKNKGLVAETFDWDEEEVSDEEEVTQVKVLIALTDDKLTVGNNHARNGEWVDITIRKRHIREPIWYLDSGCSRSMTGVKSYLYKYVKQPGPKVVFGDNSSCITEGYGSINGGGVVFIKVAFVNGLKYNLISISQLCDAKTDNGSGFRNHELESFFDEKGICQNFSSPYTPEQNGVAERKNRTLIEIARTMLNGSVLSKHFWTEADHLGKFDAKADDGYFLGYSFVSKAFRIFNTRRQQVEETYHVTFDESIEAIRFTNTSVDEIRIEDFPRYHPDEFL